VPEVFKALDAKPKGVLDWPRVTRFSAVISSEELSLLLAEPELRIVDCRSSLQDVAKGRAAFTEAHLPGASFADLLDDLSGPIVPGQTGRHPLPSVATFAAKVRGWGIGATSQVVVYDDAGGAFAARLWWMPLPKLPPVTSRRSPARISS